MALRFPSELSVLVEVLRSPFLAIQFISEAEDFDLEFVFFNHPEKYDIALEEGISFAEKLLKRAGIFGVFEFFSKRLIVFDQGLPKVRKDKLELFHFLSTSLDFNQIVTYELFKEFSEYDFSYIEPILKRFNSSDILIDSQLPKVLKEVSDLHIHLGGALRFPWRFRDIMDFPLKVDLRYLPKDPIIDSLPRYFPIEPKEDVREILSFLILLTSAVERILVEFLETGKELRLDGDPVDVLRTLPSLRERVECGFSENKFLNKALSSIRRNKILEGDRFFLLALFSSLKNYGSLTFNYLQAYLILRSYIKSLMVQQHRRSGFLYFSWFSRSTLRRRKVVEEYDHIAASLRASFPYSVKLNVEARLSPLSTPGEYFRSVSKIFKRLNRKKLNVKFIFHFIKEKISEVDSESWIRREEQRKRLLKQTKMFLKFLDIYGDRKINRKVKISRLIAGIDVASREHYAPPEVFSQIYLLLKRSVYHFCRNSKVRHDFSFTYHVGEEFKSVLLGILRIYESIYFLNLFEGDRIGHGVALGISVEEFFKRRRNSCFLKRQEFIDALAFLYFIFTRLKPSAKQKELLVIKDRVELLLREALARTSHVFRNLYPRVNDYIDSWLLRRNSPIEFIQLFHNFMEKSGDRNLDKAIDNFTNLICDRGMDFINTFKSCVDLDDWEFYTALPDLFIEKLKLPGQDVLQIERLIGNPYAWKFYYLYNYSHEWFNFMEDFHHEAFPESDFLELISETQKVLRDLIKKRGITVEVLLSSNLLITPLEEVEEHPIFTFLEDNVRVVLGTDNPGIQETNIRFELELLYSKLTEKFGEKKACKILKEIVEEGNFLFWT